jgi:hypothetical protein
MRTLGLILIALAITSNGFAQAQITDPSCGGILHGIASNSANQPVPSIQLMLWPIGVDLGYVLPHITTSASGEFWFEHVCVGRFTVVVEDEKAGFPPSIWSYVLGNKLEARLTSDRLRIELPVLVPQKASSLNFVVRDSRTKDKIRTLHVELRTSKVKMHDWITFNHDSSQPLLVPANTDLLCRVGAVGYKEWQGEKNAGHPFRLGPEAQLTLDVELEPMH